MLTSAFTVGARLVMAKIAAVFHTVPSANHSSTLPLVALSPTNEMLSSAENTKRLPPRLVSPFTSATLMEEPR